MKQGIGRALTLLALALAALYGSDYLIIRYRILKNRDPFGQVTVQPYYAVHQKNGKTEYDFAPTEVDVCIHAVFPHLGYSPCWYATRHRDKAIDI
jgi:hypothetical protein